MNTISFSCEVPVRYDVDICITGAGPGGVAAAVTAARKGANVLLLDAHTMPGGMSTAARVPVLMTVSDGIRLLPDGFGREIMERSAAFARERRFDNSWLPIHAEQLKWIYEDLLTQAGVEL